MSSNPLKIYLEKATKICNEKCHGMEVPMTDDTRYTHLFADDQLLIPLLR